MATETMAIARVEQTAMQRAQDFMPVFDIDMAVQRRDSMVQFTKKILIDGTDFGTIPGTNKPCLLKPGAEKLCTFFGLSPEFIVAECIEDWTGKEHGNEALFYYRYKCRLTKNERLIGEGEGSCSSWESKYRYRWVNEDGVPANADKSKLVRRDGSITEPAFAINKAETGGKWGKPAEYWQAFKDAIANKTAIPGKRDKKGSNEKMDTWTIGATQYRIPNPDIADIVNTVQKMAQKRALVAAILVGVGASEFFTQDMDDFAPEPSHTDHQQVMDAEFTEAPPRMTQESKAAYAKVVAHVESLPPAEVIPPEVKNMWARMTDKFSALKVFSELKDMLYQVCGNAAGEGHYRRILAKHGVEKSDQFKTMGHSRKCAADMLTEAFELARIMAKEGHLHVTDEDFPQNMQSTEDGKLFDTTKDLTYAE